MVYTKNEDTKSIHINVKYSLYSDNELDKHIGIVYFNRFLMESILIL